MTSLGSGVHGRQAMLFNENFTCLHSSVGEWGRQRTSGPGRNPAASELEMIWCARNVLIRQYQLVFDVNYGIIVVWMHLFFVNILKTQVSVYGLFVLLRTLSKSWLWFIQILLSFSTFWLCVYVGLFVRFNWWLVAFF